MTCSFVATTTNVEPGAGERHSPKKTHDCKNAIGPDQLLPTIPRTYVKKFLPPREAGIPEGEKRGAMHNPLWQKSDPGNENVEKRIKYASRGGKTKNRY